MVFEEDFEGFAGDLAVEQEVVVADDQEDGSGAGLEVLQVTSFNRALTMVMLNGKSVVVDLTFAVSTLVAWCALPRHAGAYLIAEFPRKFEKRKDGLMR